MYEIKIVKLVEQYKTMFVSILILKLSYQVQLFMFKTSVKELWKTNL
jgi:hypothetical protein